MPTQTDEAIFSLINQFADAVAGYIHSDTKSAEKRMEATASKLFQAMTGKSMPKELQQRILQ